MDFVRALAPTCVPYPNRRFADANNPNRSAARAAWKRPMSANGQTIKGERIKAILLNHSTITSNFKFAAARR